MYARQTTIQIDPARLEDGIRFFREQTIPTIRRLGGKGARLLVDRRSGKAQAISLWETAEAAETAQAAMNQNRERAVQQLGSQAATSELFEVAVMEDF
jgi:hypothetical protein